MFVNSDFDLTSHNDFKTLYNYLNTIKYDINIYDQKNTSINILDYHIVYQFGIKGGITAAEKYVKYAFHGESMLDNSDDSFSVMLPVSYCEMQDNWAIVRDCITSIKIEDIEILRKDKAAQEFSKTLGKYLEILTDPNKKNELFSLTRQISKKFRKAFFANPNKKVKASFKKVLKFYYADNLFIQPYTQVLDFVDNNNFSLLVDKLSDYGLLSFDYDDDIYKKALDVLTKARFKYRSDIVDSLCYAITHKINRILLDCNVRYFTSPAVYNALHDLNKGVRQNNKFVRNTYLMALERYICNQHSKNFESAINYINYWIKTIKAMMKYKKINKKQSDLKTKIRDEFLFKFVDDIKNTLDSNYMDPLYDMLKNPDPLFYITNEDEILVTIEEIAATLSWIETVDGDAIKSETQRIAKEYIALFELLHEVLSKNDFLNKQVKRAKNNLDKKFEESNLKNLQDELQVFKRKTEKLVIYNNDTDDLDDINRLAKELLKDKETKHQAVQIIRDAFNTSKDKNLLILANQFKNIMSSNRISIKLRD